MIGREVGDPRLGEVSWSWPFEVTQDGTGRHMIGFPNDEDRVRPMYPEEICALVLREMKRIAEKHCGLPVRKAIVTVPAYFNSAQK